MKQALLYDAVGSVFRALPALVPHHVLLIRKIGLVQLVRQISHAVGLQPEGKLQLVRRQCFIVVGAIEIRRSIDVRCSRGLQITIVRAAWNVLRTFEHHVFEQVRETRAPG